MEIICVFLNDNKSLTTHGMCCFFFKGVFHILRFFAGVEGIYKWMD